MIFQVIILIIEYFFNSYYLFIILLNKNIQMISLIQNIKSYIGIF